MGLVFKNLNRDNIKITPYTAHKTFTAVNSQSAEALGIKWYEGYNLPGFFSPADPDQGDSTTEVTTSDGQYKKLIHASIDRLYYDGKDNPYETYCNSNPVEQIRELNDRVTVMSIPQQIFGDAIKPGSLQLTFSSSNGYGPSILKDDGYGNLFDSTIDSAYSFINPTASKVYVGYWENYKYTRGYTSSDYTYNSFYWPHLETRVDGSVRAWADSYNMRPLNSGVYYQGWFGASAHYSGRSGTRDDGSIFHDDTTLPTTTNSLAPAKSSENDMSYTVLRGTGNLDFDDDFAITLRFRCNNVNVPHTFSFSGPVDPLTGHRTARSRNQGTIITKEEWFGGHCPLSVYVKPDTSMVYFKRRSKAGGETTVSSSYTTNSWTTSLCQKADGKLYIYKSSVLQDSAIDKADGLVTTTSTPIHIGARRYGKRVQVKPDILDSNLLTKNKKWKYTNHIDPFFGSIDEVHIHNASMSHAERTAYVTSYGQNGNNTSRVGNVMYEHGIATITTPSVGNKSFYHDLSGSYSDIRFKASHDLTEHVYICNVLDGEYNLTENVTVREQFNPRNDNMQAYTTSSDWSPYITTIGLYDKENNLCAVGKLAQPVQNPSDYDLSFMVRFDTNPH